MQARARRLRRAIHDRGISGHFPRWNDKERRVVNTPQDQQTIERRHSSLGDYNTSARGAQHTEMSRFDESRFDELRDAITPLCDVHRNVDVTPQERTGRIHIHFSEIDGRPEQQWRAWTTRGIPDKTLVETIRHRALRRRNLGPLIADLNELLEGSPHGYADYPLIKPRFTTKETLAGNQPSLGQILKAVDAIASTSKEAAKEMSNLAYILRYVQLSKESGKSNERTLEEIKYLLGKKRS